METSCPLAAPPQPSKKQRTSKVARTLSSVVCQHATASHTSTQIVPVISLPQGPESSSTSASTTDALPGFGGPLVYLRSHLEVISIAKPTMNQYQVAVTEFVTMCQLMSLNWRTDEELDSVIVYILDKLFFDCRAADDGNRLVAAIRWFLPRYRRGGAGHLPRTLVALAAYTKRRPGQQRLPLPWVVVCAMIGVLILRGRKMMALQIAMAFWGYLRPSESDNILSGNLVPPSALAGVQYVEWGLLLFPMSSGVPDKTGNFDESIVLEGFNCLAPLLSGLKSGKSDSDRIWPHTPVEMIREWDIVVNLLGLDVLNPSRYALRHGGASEDLLSRRRSVPEVKRRGRWVSDVSLKRYGKETRLLKELLKVHANVLDFGRYVMEHFVEVMLGTRPVPSLPGRGRVSAEVEQKIARLAAATASSGSFAALK